VHDPAARPRRISEFLEIEEINEVLGLVRAATRLADGTRHVEADLSAALELPVLAIDISAGAGAVRRSLQHYMSAHGVAHVLAVDVGGDALCTGDEPTLRSPICDQVMLCALCGLGKSASLAIAGLGADGELTAADFSRRFRLLASRGAYFGALDIADSDAERLRNVLCFGKSECSACILRMMESTDPGERARLRAAMNAEFPDPDAVLQSARYVPLRSGLRRGELTALTAMTLYFDLPVVFETGRFCALIREGASVDEVARSLRAAGIATEFDERPA